MTNSLFSNIFGVTMQTAAILYTVAWGANKDIAPLWVLQFLFWVRQYPTVRAGAFHWGCDPKTFASHYKAVLFALFDNLDYVKFLFVNCVFSLI